MQKFKLKYSGWDDFIPEILNAVGDFRNPNDYFTVGIDLLWVRNFSIRSVILWIDYTHLPVMIMTELSCGIMIIILDYAAISFYIMKQIFRQV